MIDLITEETKNKCLEDILDMLNVDGFDDIDLAIMRKNGVRVMCGKDKFVIKDFSLSYMSLFISGYCIAKLYYVNEVLNGIGRFDYNHKKSKVDIIKEYIQGFEPKLIKTHNVKFIEQHDNGYNSKYEYRRKNEQFITYEELLEVLKKVDYKEGK